MRIFISYRREDSEPYAHELKSTLAAARIGGQACTVFLDVDDLPLGSPFAGDIVGAVRSCDVVIAVVGRNWLVTAGQRRLDEDDDFVRLEQATAFADGTPVVVVLVDRGSVPPATELPADIRGVATEAPVVRIDNADFDAGVHELVRRLEGLGISTRGGPITATLRLSSNDMRSSLSSGVRCHVRVNRKRVGMFISGTPHTDFEVEPGPAQIRIGRSLRWSDPVTVTLRAGQVTSVYYHITLLGSTSLRAVSAG